MSSVRHRLCRRALVLCAIGSVSAAVGASPALQAQSVLVPSTDVQLLQLATGRSFPISSTDVIKKVTVVNAEIADVVVISERDVVINALKPGETDIILWGTRVPRRHIRVQVRTSGELRQILLSVKFAEIRKDALRDMGASLMLRTSNGGSRIGAGAFSNNNNIDASGSAILPSASKFLTVLSNFGSKELLALLDAEEQHGNARSLAEPNLMAANGEKASFLAGGEIPVPVVQGGAGGGQQAVTIQYREFGIRLNFTGEVLNDSLIKLKVSPEVSSLDYSNAVTVSGFRVPALRTRKIESTIDVLQDRSLIISGLYNDEREQVKTGLPFFRSIPILGELFSSTRWTHNESELIVIVTPTIIDPNNPRASSTMRFAPDTTVPAAAALVRPPKTPAKPPR